MVRVLGGGNFKGFALRKMFFAFSVVGKVFLGRSGIPSSTLCRINLRGYPIVSFQFFESKAKFAENLSH